MDTKEFEKDGIKYNFSLEKENCYLFLVTEEGSFPLEYRFHSDNTIWIFV